MKLKIYTLKGIEYDGEVASLNVKTASGEITVMDNHRPLMTILKKGELKIVGKDGVKKEIAADRGFLEVRPGSEVSVILG